MPIYQYECDKCGHQFELHRESNEDDKELKCPKCGAEHPRRFFSACNICPPAGGWIPRGGG